MLHHRLGVQISSPFQSTRKCLPRPFFAFRHGTQGQHQRSWSMVENWSSSVVLDLRCERQLWFYSRLSSSSSSCVIVIWALPWITAVRCSSDDCGHTHKPCVDWTTLCGPILMFQSLNKCRRKGSNRGWLIKQLQTIEWQLRVIIYDSMDSSNKNEILKKIIYAHILHNSSKNDDEFLDDEAPCMKQISGSHVNSCRLCSLRHNDTVIRSCVSCVVFILLQEHLRIIALNHMIRICRLCDWQQLASQGGELLIRAVVQDL